MSQRRALGLATVVMALATFLSRIAGLVRDVVVARVFGAGFVSDAFFMAFTIPNLLRRFFAEGSLTAAFIPVYTEVLTRDGEVQAEKFAGRSLALLGLVLLLVVAAGIFFAPWLARVVGYGFSGVAGKLELTVTLTRLMFPYIGLVSLLAFLTGLLNVRGHFFLPALSPLLLNLGMICGALFLGGYFAQPVYGLALGVLAGGVAQLVLQYPALRRFRIRLRPDFRFGGDAALARVVRLMLPGIAGVAIYQVNVIVTRLLASFLPQGSVSYLYYAQRLFEFPQGIFIVSLAQAVLPLMSRQAAMNDQREFRESLHFAFSAMVVVTLPAIFGLVICAKPVYSLFFMGGEFDRAALDATALALIYFAPGLLFVGLSRVAAQTFYALKDTRTPVVVSFLTLLVNAVCGYVLMGFWGHLGLALALTLASVFNALLLVALLRRRLAFPFIRIALCKPLWGVIPAVVGMIFITAPVVFLADWDQPGVFLFRLGLLAGGVVAGTAAYVLFCLWFRVEEVSLVWQRVCRRRGVKTYDKQET
jgi:putative peptidoglycan lipid II flippase